MKTNIWKTEFSLADIQARNADTLFDYVGIEFTEIGPDYLVAEMPVLKRVTQPIGIMHGGASCVLAESVGSVGANYCVDINSQYCVGLDINTNHIKSIRQGKVIATARPWHIGHSTQVWHIEICDQAQQLISVSRLTMAVLTRRSA